VSASEHLITVLEGVVEFQMSGEVHRVERRGEMFVPANVPYEYRNVVSVDACSATS
jgi:quercetin dioxygenase-like cupin family protein